MDDYSLFQYLCGTVNNIADISEAVFRDRHICIKAETSEGLSVSIEGDIKNDP